MRVRITSWPLTAVAVLLGGCSFNGRGVWSGGGDVGQVDRAGERDATARDAASDLARPDSARPDRGVDGPMVCLSAAGTLCALPAPAITIDADLKDWSTEGWVSLTDWAGLGSSETTPPAAADLSAQLAARWDAGALYLAVKVTDDSHNNLYYSDPCSMENGDSVQVAFDVAGDQGDELDDTDDYVYGWGVAGSGIGCRWWAPSSAGKSSYTFAVKRAIPSTTYEVRLPAADLGLAGLVVGKALGFAARVNESDIGSYGRDGFLAWQGGSGEDWDPSKFGVLKLSP